MKLFRLLSSARMLLPRVFPLMRHPGVPLAAKLATIAAAILIVSPLDILGDIPVIGLFDDAILLSLLGTTFVRFGESQLTRPGRTEPKIVTPIRL